jgi:hypothetical protein
MNTRMEHLHKCNAQNQVSNALAGLQLTYDAWDTQLPQIHNEEKTQFQHRIQWIELSHLKSHQRVAVATISINEHRRIIHQRNPQTRLPNITTSLLLESEALVAKNLSLSCTWNAFFWSFTCRTRINYCRNDRNKGNKISWVIDSLPCATSKNMFLVTHKYTNSYNTECATSTNKFLVTQKYTNTYNAEHSCARKSFRDNGLVLHRKQHLSFLEHRYYCPSILLTLKIIHS